MAQTMNGLRARVTEIKGQLIAAIAEEVAAECGQLAGDLAAISPQVVRARSIVSDPGASTAAIFVARVVLDFERESGDRLEAAQRRGERAMTIIPAL